MKYFAGYVYPDNARGFRREYNTRIALYDIKNSHASPLL